MNQVNANQDTIDLKQLFFSIVEQWKLIVVCIVICLIFAIIYLKITPNQYSVDALVQVESKKGASAALLGELSNVVEQESPAQAEIEILRSRLVLGSVIEELALDLKLDALDSGLISKILDTDKPTFFVNANGIKVDFKDQSLVFKKFELPFSVKDQDLTINFNKNAYTIFDSSGNLLVRGLINTELKTYNRYGKWHILITGSNSKKLIFTANQMSLPEAIDNLKRNLTVAEVGKLTGIIRLTFQGTNKENIKVILNTILQKYSVQNIERSSAETAETLKFLNNQLPQLKNDLDKAEFAFNQFRKQFNTIDISKESNLYLDQVSLLQTQKIQLEQKRSELSAKYTSDHPVMKQIGAELNSLNQNISNLNATLKSLPDTQRKYVQLQRNVEVQTQLYNNLLNSFQQLRVAKAGEIGNVRIIDNAVLPKDPIKPLKFQVLALAIFMGFFLGTVIAFIRNILHTGVKDALLLEDQLQLPVYATIPRSQHQEHRAWRIKKSRFLPILSYLYPDDPSVESLRNLRTALYFSLKNSSNNVILIAGPSPEIGKSFIAVNLATVLAQSGKKVLLVDADLRRGYLHKYFKVNNAKGISSLLTNSNLLESAIIKSEINGLEFLPRGPAPKAPSELLGSNEFKQFIQRLSANYDYVIIDSAPMLAVTDALVVAELAGTCLLVARHSMTSIKELELSLQRFNQSGIKVNGLILNDIERKVGYGYGNYGYGYNYNYKAQD